MTPHGPFMEQELIQPGLIRRILNRPIKGNAAIEVENRFAQAASVQEVSSWEVEGILEAHGRQSTGQLASEFAELYRAYLEYCLRDHRLGEDEIAALRHLKDTLALTDTTIDPVHSEVTSKIYRQNVDQAIADGRGRTCARVTPKTGPRTTLTGTSSPDSSKTVIARSRQSALSNAWTPPSDLAGRVEAALDVRAHAIPAP